MTLTEARTRVRFFINEPTAAQWTDTELDGLIIAANREVYADIVARTIDYFHKTVRVKYTPGLVSLDLAGAEDLDAGGTVGNWSRIIAIFKLQSDADPSSSNVPQVVPVAEDLLSLYDSGRVGPDEDPWNGVINSGGSYKVCANMLFLYPFSDSDEYLWIHFVPKVTDPSGGGSVLLDGYLTQHHDIIPMLAAIDILMNVGEDSADLKSRFSRRFQTMVDTIGLQQQSQSPTRVTSAH
tara:strand:- start:197 stop:910 length:714 start_codon:yes stop_codon:yes gene_type:complete